MKQQDEVTKTPIDEPSRKIFICNKKPMEYVIACIQKIHESRKNVKILSRGRKNSINIDVAEILKRKFGFTVDKIKTSSVEKEKGKFVSVLSIIVSKEE